MGALGRKARGQETDSIVVTGISFRNVYKWLSGGSREKLMYLVFRK